MSKSFEYFFLSSQPNKMWISDLLKQPSAYSTFQRAFVVILSYVSCFVNLNVSKELASQWYLIIDKAKNVSRETLLENLLRAYSNYPLAFVVLWRSRRIWNLYWCLQVRFFIAFSMTSYSKQLFGYDLNILISTMR